MVNDNFYVVTGGPGGGKTSILGCLAAKGFIYIPETAREIIRERLAKGLPPRPAPAVFAREMFLKDYDNYISNSHTSALLFFDRSFIDSASLLYHSDIDAYNEIKDTHLLHRYNKKVFITPPWEEIYCNDAERDQTFKQAISVYRQLHDWYIENEYEVIILPKDTIENRAAFILGIVK